MKTLLPVLLASLLVGAAPAFAASATPKSSAPAAPAEPAKPAPAPKTETVDLQAKGRIVLTLPAGWTAVREDPDNPLDLTLKAPAGVNAIADLMFGFPEEGKLESVADVRAEATTMGENEAEEMAAVEKRTVLQTYKLRSGYGFYSSYTDPKLVGKKPVPEDYKTSTIGLIRLAPGIVCIVRIFCDDLAGIEFKELQQVVETLEVLGPGGARRKAEI